MEIIQKIYKLSELPDISNVDGSKILLTYNRQNYIIDSEILKGKKIIKITEVKSPDDGGRNTIVIKFSDKSTVYLYTYNGTQGIQGRTGDDGDKGDTGASRTIKEADLKNLIGDNATLEDNVFHIINDFIVDSEYNNPIHSHDDSCNDGWSAYRGKSINDMLNSMNETFVADKTYDLLFDKDKIVYMVAEFTTELNNEETSIFNSDTNEHIQYKKYWTYEESDIQTYYIAIYGNIEIPGSQTTEYGILRYDPVAANLWTDIYLGNTSGYFLSTDDQLNDLSPLYYYDSHTYPENPYRLIDVDDRKTIESDIIGGEPIDNPEYKNKNFTFYSETLKLYISAHYTFKTNSWTYELSHDSLESNYVKPLYKVDITKYELDDDGNRIYSLLDLVNTTHDGYIEELDEYFTQYYYKNDLTATIQSISKYTNLIESSQRCFVKNQKTGKYNEVDYEGLTSEEKENYLESLDNNLDEYIIVIYDSNENTYTFENHYVVKTLLKTTLKVDTEVYQTNSFPVYSYFSSREYYTMSVEQVTNPSTNEIEYENIYTRIQIPTWIYAEFTTTEEDEETLIINKNKDEEGPENNDTIDITEEGYEDAIDYEVIPIKFMTYDNLPAIYQKTASGRYDEVDIDDLDISGNTEYYHIVGNYSEITGEEALSLPSGIDIYSTPGIINTGAISIEKTYYIWTETQTKIDNIYDLVSNHDIIVYTGVPKQLPIKFIPNNATYKVATINYDSDVITLLENGRICAITPILDDHRETNTTLTIDPEGNGNTLTFNIKVLTPTKNIVIQLTANNTSYSTEDENYDIKMNIGETANINCIASPLETSDPTIEFLDDNLFELSNISSTYQDNTTRAQLTAINKGIANISAVSNDRLVQKTMRFEVVKPVDSISWNTENNIVKAIHYENYEVIQWNNTHPENEHISTDTIKEYDITLLKDVKTELNPIVLPLDSSYPEVEWTVSNNRFITIETIQEETTTYDEATQEDVDNEDAQVVGEQINIKTKIEPKYYITGLKTTVTKNYINGYESNDENSNRVFITGKLKNIYGELSNDESNKFPITAYISINQSVENVNITPNNLVLNIGISKKLTATMDPDIAGNYIVWSSSDEEIATVNDGVVTAINPGNAQIIATASDGSGKFASCSLEVTIPIENINLRNNSINNVNGIIYLGLDKSTTINADLIYEYSDSNSTHKKGVDWISTDENIIEISNETESSCTISGIQIGTTTLVAKAKDNSGTIGAIQVMVINQINSIRFAGIPEEGITLDINDSLALKPVFVPEEATHQVLIWSSSDPTIATVNSSGIVTAISEGTTEISAMTTDGSEQTASLNITIRS